MPGPITCTACKAVLPMAYYGAGDLNPCPSCGSLLLLAPFPALVRPAQDNGAGTKADEGEAGCFFHPLKRASHSCDACGRFICDLCDVPMGNGHLCPDCLTSGREKGTRGDLVNRRVLHDQTALSLAVYPMIMVFPTLVTAPIALYYAIRHWNSPTSLLPRSKFRMVLAMGIALGQMAVWASIFLGLFK